MSVAEVEDPFGDEDQVHPFEDAKGADVTRSTLKVVPEEPLLFEGRVVDACVTKISGLTGLEDSGGLVLHTDDRLRLVVEARVTGVNHSVDKDGKLIRTHSVKVIVADPAPWDPTDPNDDGVLRA